MYKNEINNFLHNSTGTALIDLESTFPANFID